MEIEKALLIQYLCEVDELLSQGIDTLEEDYSDPNVETIKKAQGKVEYLFELLTEK